MRLSDVISFRYASLIAGVKLAAFWIALPKGKGALSPRALTMAS